MQKSSADLNFHTKEKIMVLSDPTFWLILLPTGVTGIFLLRQAKRLAEEKARKAPVPIRIQRQRRQDR
jgi:hypothetical protein